MRNYIYKEILILEKIHRKKEIISRNYKINGVKINYDIFPNVFRPDITDTSKIIIDYLSKNESNFKNKKYLDMGCGTGIISIFISKKGGDVWAIDRNKKAIKCTKHNLNKNNCKSLNNVIKSDLFKNFNKKILFDMIIFNPPFFGINKNYHLKDIQHAWSGGIEVIEEFLIESLRYLTINGNIVICLPTFLPLHEIFEKYTVKSLNYRIVDYFIKNIDDHEYKIYKLEIERYGKILKTNNTENMSDIFLRYNQNDNLLTMISNFIGLNENDYHIEIGFNGSLGIYSCLAKNIYFLNPAEKQLKNGVKITKDLIFYFKNIANKSITEIESYLSENLNFDWLDVNSENNKKILLSISKQFNILSKSNKSLKNIKKFNLIPSWFTKHINPNIFENNDYYEMFDTALLIDVFSNINFEIIESVFEGLNFILKNRGRALLTFFPQGYFNREKNYIYVEDIYKKLAQQFNINFKEIYYPYQKFINLKKLNDIILKNPPNNYEKLRLVYWLDMDKFWLQDYEDIKNLCKFNNLEIIEEKKVPGAMQNSLRYAFIVEKKV